MAGPVAPRVGDWFDPQGKPTTAFQRYLENIERLGEIDDLTALLDSQFGADHGSILYRNASEWVALAPGTSGHFLKTLGSAANPEWAAVEQNRVFISAQTVSGSPTAVDFTGLSNAYAFYEFVFENVVPATDDVDFNVRYSTDNAASFITTNYVSSATDRIPITSVLVGARVANTANLGLSGVCKIHQPSSTANVKWTNPLVQYARSGGSFLSASGGGYNTTLSAVNAVRFYFQASGVASQITSGVIRMYGIKGS